MNEDQIKPITGPAAVGIQPEAVVPVAPVTTGTKEFIKPTHELFKTPQGEGLEIMEGVEPPTHIGIEEVGGLQTPPPPGSVDGSSIVLSPPDGFSDKEQVYEALGSKPGWRRWASHVWRRQQNRLDEKAA